MRFLSVEILRRITRRAGSSWVSPGPRRPMPPRVRERGGRVVAWDVLADALRYRRICKAFQLLEVLVDVQRIVGALARGTNQKGPLDGRLDINQFPNRSSAARAQRGVCATPVVAFVTE